MKYKWDLDILKKEKWWLLKDLILNPRINEQKRKEIKTTLEILNSMLEEIKSANFYVELPICYLDKTDILSKNYYNDFKKINPKYLNIAFDLIPIMNNLPTKDITLNTISFSTQEMIETTREFYQSLPDQKYYQKIEKFLNPKNQLLQINQNSQITYYTGYTLLLFYPTNHFYVIVYKENTLIDLYTLIHELSHVYYLQYLKAHNLSTPYYYLMEVEGRMFDYLTSSFLIKKGYPKTEIEKTNRLQLEDQLETITSLYLGQTVVDLYEQKNVISKENLKNKIENKYPDLIYSFDSLEDDFSYSPRDYLKEVVSYLAFLDLKEIADRDLEKALFLLENIKKDTNPFILSTLRKNEITFMRDGYINLQKEIELVKQYKL